ncbi:M48 family metalloprotease [Acinetobacter sp. MD2(2019)]|uniref:M48 family metalloprotease n=1 Tax=Acinetobacter sp. MD2(2019) TaxID=2605273 RepID=UPI002D770513|nr:M48 family metalloprotease [Acinetobacter sp. MD2(2019)]
MLTPRYIPEANLVPEIGSGTGLLDQQNERYLGEKVYREIHQHLPLIQDIWLQDQLNEIFTKIWVQTNLPQPIGLLIINDPQVNAFAVPGGVFAINTGLILLAQNSDEVASVIGHEIAHVTQKHYSRSQEAFKGQGLLALAGILVGAAIASKSDGNAGSAIMLGTQAALIDHQLSYSRDQEREADRIGMQYMTAAGYNPASMADFFERMQRSSSQVSFMPEFWLTHPLTTQRMSEARLRASQLPPVKLNLDHRQYDLIRWYTGVITNKVTENQLLTLVAQNNQSAKLALTALYVQQGDFKKAQQVLDGVSNASKNNVLAVLLKTDILMNQQQFDHAKQVIAAQQVLMPENRALSYKYAEVLIRQKNTVLAQQVVKKILQDNPRDVAGWDLMMRAENENPASLIKQINVLRYRAETQFWSGLEEDGIKSLLHAQRLSKDNPSLLATVDARLKQMQQERLYHID